ncbi:MAG: histidine phosphatase family protein [Bacteroidota bacterium]
MKSIYFIRHGETELNRLKIVQGGGVDASLNDTGRTQAQAFYNTYRAIPFEAVLTSTLKRTHETVAPFLENGLPWEQFSEIDEMSWGEHEGKAGTPAMREEYLQLTAAWSSGDYSARIKGGESAEELAVRVQRFIELLKVRPEQCLLVCAHGRLMRCLICLLKGQALSNMQQFQHANTGLYQVQFVEDSFHFLRDNDTTHLTSVSLVPTI